MTTVRIQSVGSSYASRLPARQGKEINDIGDEEAEKQSVWRTKQHADVRNQENKLKMCCGYLSYRSLLTVLATKPKACISRSRTAWRITDQLSDCGLIHDNHYLVARS